MCLGEMTRYDPRTELPLYRMRDLLAGQQPQEGSLSRAVRAKDRDSLAVEDLEIEGFHNAAQLQALARHGTHSGSPSPQPHPDILFTGRFGRRPGLFEFAQPGLCRLITGCHCVTTSRILLHVMH